MAVNIVRFRQLFFEKLNAKTNWGKEQVKRAFDDTLAEMVDQHIETY